MPKITPFLWFNDQAEAAAKFYTSIFKNSRICVITRYSELGPGPVGSVMTVEFELDGQIFTALNGGPVFQFNQAISFVVHCKTQRELDTYWKELTADGGKPVECGWLQDKYGVSWQIVPEGLHTLISAKDMAASERVMCALMKMKKLDIKKLKAAHAKRR